MPNYKPVLHPTTGAPLLNESGIPKIYDADLNPDGPPSSCCCGSTCEECFGGSQFFLCVTVSGTVCPIWDNTYCVPFQSISEIRCDAQGFTIIQDCGYTLPGIGGRWDGNTLCIRIADISGTIHEWCGEFSCDALEDGLTLPNTLGGGSCTVRNGGGSGCPNCA